MGVQKVTGIVCRYTNYRDNDRILTLYTRELGRLDAAARGCRRQKSPLLASSQPFVYAQFVLFQNRDKYSVDTADIRESFYPLRSDYGRCTAGLAMLALTVDHAQPGLPNDSLFSTLYHMLSYLAYTDCDPEDLWLAYLLKYLDHNGYRPAVTHCARCNQDLRKLQNLRFFPQAGGAVCPNCGGGKPVQRLALEAMRRILALPDENLQKIQLPHKIRLELRELLTEYAEAVLERKIVIFST